MNEKEIVWLPKELARKVKDIDSDAELEKLIMKHIEDSKFSLTREIESLEEHVLLFRGLMVKARQEFKKAKEEELESFETVWGKAEEDIRNTRSKIEEIRNLLTPLKNDLKEVKQMYDSINAWDFEKLNEILRTFSSLYGENKKILEFLVQNYASKS